MSSGPTTGVANRARCDRKGHTTDWASSGDGSFSYDSTAASALQALDTGETAHDTFTYTATNNDGQADTRSRVLAMLVDAHIACGDLDAAAATAERLEAVARERARAYPAALAALRGPPDLAW